MARTQLALASVSFLKGASEKGGGGGGGGDENKNKFEKLKANTVTDPIQKRGSLFPSETKEFAWGVCNHWANTSGTFKAISSSSLSFEGGIGGKGRRGVSDPKCNQ